MTDSRGEPNPGYEVTDVRPGPIAAATAALIVLVAVTIWCAGLLFDGLVERAEGRDGAAGLEHARSLEAPVPVPRLQASPAYELGEHRALEASRTEEYAWVDRGEGVLRIPVERAMELLVERGLPTRAQGEGEGR